MSVTKLPMETLYELSDDYDHLDNDLEYILENVLSENVKKNIDKCDESKKLNELFNSLLLNKCECNQYFFLQCSHCSHGSNYIFNEEFQELVLRDVQNLPDLIYECSNICKCEKRKCHNRLVQYGPRNFLKIVWSPRYCSKGLITLKDIPKGAFICEYAGELLTTNEAQSLMRNNEIYHKMNYVLFLKESCISEANTTTKGDKNICLTIVDPSKKGNIGRYLNHSCDPNCHIVVVRTDSPIPKIAFFTKRSITAGEEICFNYNEGLCPKTAKKTAVNKIPCLCGSKNCLRYLPNSEL